MRLYRLSLATRILCSKSTTTSAFKEHPGVSGPASVVDLGVSRENSWCLTGNLTRTTAGGLSTDCGGKHGLVGGRSWGMVDVPFSAGCCRWQAIYHREEPLQVALESFDSCSEFLEFLEYLSSL